MPETRRTLYRNWVKGGLGLLYTKEGIQSFVDDEIQSFHSNIYNKVLRAAGLPAGTQCSSCTIENVLPCPTFGICSARNCRFHDRSDPAKSYRLCPNGICDRIKDEIITAHRQAKPSFRNTSTQLWSTSSWELAKCYMAPTGYQDKQTPDDTDVSGLISVILNHMDFQTKVYENLTVPGNLFDKGRDIRNEIMHNARMETSTVDLNSFFQTLTDILSDRQCLNSLPHAIAAINKLQQLKQDLITITTEDEQRIYQEAQTALKLRRDEFIEDLAEETTEGLKKIDRKGKAVVKRLDLKKDTIAHQMDRTLQSGVKRLKQKQAVGIIHFKQKQRLISNEIESKTKRSIDQIGKETAASVAEIIDKEKEGTSAIERVFKRSKKRFYENVDDAIDESKDELHSKTKRLKRKLTKKSDEICQTIKKKSSKLFSQQEHKFETLVKESTQTGIGKIKDEETRAVQALREEKLFINTVNEAEYYQKRTDLKSEVIEHYLSNGYTKSAISALIDDEEVDIEDIFVMPSMKTIVHGAFESSKDIKQIEEMFYKDNQIVRKVCISSDAGRGKTTLCQWLVSSWCKSQTDIKYGDLSPSQQFLQSFEFLFYIPLRNHKVVNVVDMIKNEIVREELHATLIEVLKRDSKKCLVVLDGFDEWLPSQDCSGKLPFIDPREKYSVLITSRPWKLEVLRPKISEIGQEIQIKGLTDEKLLIKVIVGCLKRKFGKVKDPDMFLEEVKARKIEKLSEIPILLTQMVCMWYDDVELGNTYVEIYSKMINYILQVAEKRNEELNVSHQQQYEGKGKKPKERSSLPHNFKDMLVCHNYENTLLKLSDLAYHTLFAERKENALVFPRFVTEIYNMAESDVQFCLSIGILSQAKFSTLATSQTKRLSFLHKTFQEFLAAVHIANLGDDAFGEMQKKLKSLDDVLEMSQVLIFVSGIDPSRIVPISKHVADTTESDKRVLQYRNFFTDVAYHIIGDIQNLVCSCINEGLHGYDFKQDVVLHDFGDNVTGSDISIDDQFFYFDLSKIKSFRMKYHPSKLSKWTQFEGLNLVKIFVELSSLPEHFDHLVTLINNCLPSLTTLGVSGSGKTDENGKMKTILGLISTSVHIKSIFLTDFKITHSVLMDLVNFVTQNIVLEEILLMRITCLSCQSCSYSLNLLNHSKIRYVSICGMEGRIFLGGILSLLKCMVVESTNDWSLIRGLKHAKTLVELFVFGRYNPMVPPKVDANKRVALNNMRERHIDQVRLAKEVSIVMPTLQDLKRLTLIDVHFKQKILRLSPDMNTIDTIILQRVTMTMRCLQEFVNSLMDVPSKVEVAAFYLYLTPEDDITAGERYILNKSYVKINHTVNVKNSLCMEFSNKPEEFVDIT